MILPSHEFHLTRIATPEDLYKGLDGVLHGVAGAYQRKFAYNRYLYAESEKIGEDAFALRHESDRVLRNKISEYRSLFTRNVSPSWEVIKEAMTILVERAARTTGMRAYPVQIMGALLLYKGCLVEMATGEGKTLTACFPAVLNAWSGNCCHLVTVNDYLAGRDADELRSLYKDCGLSVGCITSTMSPDERRDNYNRDIVYTTSKELTADFLRDRIQLGSLFNSSRRSLRSLLGRKKGMQSGLVMRGLHSVIVDEADSVLIDEAVTPLIISQAKENKPLTEACMTARDIVAHLKLGIDYVLDTKYKELKLNKSGYKKVDDLAMEFSGIWRGEWRRIEFVEQALIAKEFYQRGKQYVLQDGKVVIVDEFTGRLMPNRTWRQGLHQAVEAKEGVEVTAPSETLSRLSFQRFFRFFKKLSGMTGTAWEAKREFWHIYGLNVQQLPTNSPCIRKMLPDVVYPTTLDKWEGIVQSITHYHKQGRPILVGTRTVKDSEVLAALLTDLGYEFSLLNAVRHQEEAIVVARAGEKSIITIATNMAGRGTDIKLGKGVADLGGLHVIATERNESGRIDRQLFGRCARQGDPGSAQAFVSPEDELVQRFVSQKITNALGAAVKKGGPAAGKIAQRAVIYAQKTAQKQAYSQRKGVLSMDSWLDEALSFSGSSLEF